MTEVRGITPLNRVLADWSRSPHPGVLFDFNGTLCNDEPILWQIFQESFRSLPVPLTRDRYLRELAGRSDREIIQVLAGEAADVAERDLSVQLDRRQRRYRELVDQQSPVTTTTRELVARLDESGVRLGIVTGAERSEVEYVLGRAFPVGIFQVIVSADDVAHGKPHPEGYLKAAHLMALEPAHVLVFEDSIPGILAARRAGMKVIGVAGTHGANILAREADGVLAELSTELLVGLSTPGA